MSKRIPLDLSAAYWVCQFCGERVDITDDMLPPLRHKALHCALFPEDKLAEAHQQFLNGAAIGRVQRIMGAHLLKHPEDWDAAFDPASLPAWALETFAEEARAFPC